ncbi:MAG: GntR family transcriptional regulator [Proteobacteria bacterium]|nr:GntR family transcriptional regulator [Pseudomonadota bacterium]
MGIRRTGGAPMYAQVSDILAAEIESGARSDEGPQLPSENALAHEFKVSRVTVRQALKRLEARGLIYSEQGRGYFKTATRMGGVSGFHSFTREVQKAGGVPGAVVLDCRLVDHLPDEMRKHLKVQHPADVPLLYMKRVRTINAQPIAVEDAYLPVDMYPGIEEAGLGEGSLYSLIGDRWGVAPAWTDALFEPVAASDDLAQALNVPAGSPLLAVWRVTLTENDQVAEYVKSTYRGGGFMLHVSRYRLTD